MLLVLRISSVVALALAGLLFIVSGIRLSGDDPKIARIRGGPTAMQKFQEASRGSAGSLNAVSPLMAQAQAFAAHLTRSQSPAPAVAQRVVPAPRPATPVERLKLHATSYCLDQPGKSMALVSEVAAGREGQRWVRPGTRFGSFVVQEVRPGAIVYRDGDQVREAAVEPGAGRPSLVRGLRPGSHVASATVTDALRGASAPGDANGITISDN